MTLKQLIGIFSDKNCDVVYVKELSPNDNSKNQIYVAKGDTTVLNLFPTNDFMPVTSGKRAFTSFHAGIEFYWVDEKANEFIAPSAKFILYPDYPEVRFSGFLAGCKNSPKELLLNNRDIGRVLFMAVSKEGKVFGFVSQPESEISSEVIKRNDFERNGFFKVIPVLKNQIIKDSRIVLLNELKRIHEKGWIDSKQLFNGNIIGSCKGNKCGGTTLEAELGIIQNGKAEPDYFGWEIKQFGVRKLHLVNSAKITLMTPEPDGGYYKEKSLHDFLIKYGYVSPSKLDRLDFTGTYRYNKKYKKTGLTLEVNGCEIATGKISDTAGGINLMDENREVAASWSFAKLISHWKQKHAKASYIPSLSRELANKQFLYSNNIFLCTGTDFSLFMKCITSGQIYFDPGIHIENVSTKKQVPKKRSQFRMSSRTINEIYQKVELVDLLKE